MEPGKPSLEFVRIRVWLASGTGPLHVRLYAVVRDQHKGEAHDCACPGKEGGEEQEHEDAIDVEAEASAIMERAPHAALTALAERMSEVEGDAPLDERLREALMSLDDEERKKVLDHLERVSDLAERLGEESAYVG